MTPAFKPGEYLLLDRSAFARKPPSRRDAVIIVDPREPGQRYLKRIVGLPREEVRLSDGLLLVDGERLHEPYLGGLPAYLGLEESEWKLGDAEYFVLGDNRVHSTDSRDFGPVNSAQILGKVWFRVWPLNRWGRI